jgi:hypothetical protein
VDGVIDQDPQSENCPHVQREFAFVWHLQK